MKTSKKIEEAATELPTGWMREELVRKNTKTLKRKSDIIYLSPTGKKARSKAELTKFLGNEFDLTNFNYSSGKILRKKLKLIKDEIKDDVLFKCEQSAVKKTKLKINTGALNETTNESKNNSRSALQNTLNQNPFVFPRLKASDVADMVVQAIDLSRFKKALDGRNVTATTSAILQEIASNLQHVPTLGVEETLPEVTKDQNVWPSPHPHHPIGELFLITEDDIKQQENRVLAAKERLYQALKKDADLSIEEMMLTTRKTK